ncbi:glycosyl hydrolase family 28-related protein [Leuconostoc mesenteroides]|uniref:glycosyl hydrolase family 28-related protein n=1 Tax=Leuconostoc mesenteroides TaxID=1245 RepID=UPI000775F98D|nr:glycosyl hydrolase family 28-related protein [Leuconostoc mesenteroides]
MQYGDYKIISILTPSLINKGGDTFLKARYQLKHGMEFVNIDDDNACISFRNDQGYLFDISAVVRAGEFSIDYSNKNISSLPSGKYEFQISINRDGRIEKYPDDGFVNFSISMDGRVNPSGLVPQLTFDSVLNQLNNNLDAKTNEILSKTMKGDQGEQGKTGEKGEKGDTKYISIIDYGADSTGKSDSSEAFNNAINYAKSIGKNSLFIPAGTYLINSPISLPRTNVIGEDRRTTNIVVNGAKGFQIANSNLKNVNIDLTKSNAGTVGIELGKTEVDSFKGGYDSVIENISITGDFSQPETTGIEARPFADSNSNAQGVWGNVVKNVIMNNIGTGIKLVAGNYGWINGNSFEDIVIKAFYSNGILLDSEGGNALSIERNFFGNIQPDAKKIPSDKTAYGININYGMNNVFDNITEWNDTGTSDNIYALKFGTSVAAPNFWNVYNNRIVNSRFEHRITGDKRIISLNLIDVNVMSFSLPPYVTGTGTYYDIFDNRYAENHLPENIVDHYINEKEFSNIISTWNVTSGLDSLSNYLGVSGSGSIKINLYGNPLTKFMTNKFLTISTAIGAVGGCGDTSLTTLLTVIKKSGEKEAISPVKIFAALREDNEYAVNSLFDLSSKDSAWINNILYFEISITISTSNAEKMYKIRHVKASSRPILNIDRYVKEHYGVKKTAILLSNPQSWEDIGIHGSGLTYNDNLVNIKSVGEKYYVETPFIE